MGETAKRLASAVKGMFLLARYVEVFNPGMFSGKRVAVVGPANSAYNTGRGDYIDSFDVVVRINKAPQLLLSGKSKIDIGTRTDILFHSFFENDHSGGGPLDFTLFDKLGIRYVVNPIPTFFGYRLNFNFYKKYLLHRTTYVMPRGYYKDIPQAFGKFRPTTGYCALKAVLESDFADLFVTGFTFFRTAYADGYRDAMKESSQALQHIKEAKIHDPDREYEGFKRLIAGKTERTQVDETLRDILHADATFSSTITSPAPRATTVNERP